MFFVLFFILYNISMKTITEIKKIGKGFRYNLYLDNEFFGVYEAEILARHCLKTGQSFDDEFFETLKIENGDYACFNRGLSLLEKSMKSEKMLRDYLLEKGYPKRCIDKACEKLKEYGYIDDEAFCENFINSYSNIKSKRKLKYDLLSKGIKENIINEKMQNLIDDNQEKENLLNLAQKYMKNREFDIKNKQKFYNHFAGKGYDYGLISNVWEAIQNDRN